MEGRKLVEKMKSKEVEELIYRTDIKEKMKLKADFVRRLAVILMGVNEISCCSTGTPTSLEGMEKVGLEKLAWKLSLGFQERR